MAENQYDYDLAVIGSGPGGYVAAIKAAKTGMRTAVIENKEAGGTCLNRGCIPTKTILHSAEIFRELQNGGAFGIHAESISYNMEEIQSKKDEVVEQLGSGIHMLFNNNRISFYQGSGQIRDAHTVWTGEELLTTKYILIATGSVPADLPVEGASLEGVFNSDQLLERKKPCKKLVIIGGGVIGMEFASIYQALGTEVVVIEAMDRILSNMDKEIGQNLKMIMKKRGVIIYTQANLEKIWDDNGLHCSFQVKGERQEIETEAVLMAAGRKACTKGLFGDQMSVEMERDKIKVNENFQTNYENIYAAGDVIGGISLAHMASAEAINAVCHMNGEEAVMNLGTVPACVYTNPEIACVGMTAQEAKDSGIEVITSKYLMSANGKSLLTGQDRGFIKLVAVKDTGQILGAQMMCARATDMIGEIGLAIAGGLTKNNIRSVIHPHPTFSEGIWEAAELL